MAQSSGAGAKMPLLEALKSRPTASGTTIMSLFFLTSYPIWKAVYTLLVNKCGNEGLGCATRPSEVRFSAARREEGHLGPRPLHEDIWVRTSSRDSHE